MSIRRIRDDKNRVWRGVDENDNLVDPALLGWTENPFPYDPMEVARVELEEEDGYALDLLARIERIESYLWPVEEDPKDTTEINTKTFEEWGGIWPNQTLLLENDVVWRNISGVPLITPPSEFPGGVDKWDRLFVRVEVSDPVIEQPPGYVGEWSPDVNYSVNNVVSRDGVYYICRIAHGAIYRGIWGPPMPNVWDIYVVGGE